MPKKIISIIILIIALFCFSNNVYSVSSEYQSIDLDESDYDDYDYDYDKDDDDEIYVVNNGTGNLEIKDVNWCSDVESNSDYSKFNIQKIAKKNMKLLYKYTFKNRTDYEEFDGEYDKNHALSGIAVTKDDIVLSFHNSRENAVELQFINYNKKNNEVTGVSCVDGDRDCFWNFDNVTTGKCEQCKGYKVNAHANDLLYDGQHIYFTSNSDTKRIFCVNASTKEECDSIDYSGFTYEKSGTTYNYGLGEITYDSKKNTYYVLSRYGNTATDEYRFFNTTDFINYNEITSVVSPNKYSSTASGKYLISHLGFQGMATYDDLFFVELWQRYAGKTSTLRKKYIDDDTSYEEAQSKLSELGLSEDICQGYKNNNYVFVYDLSKTDDSKIYKVLHISRATVNAEIEGIDFDEDGNMIIAFGRVDTTDDDKVHNYTVYVYKVSRFDVLYENSNIINLDNKSIVSGIPSSSIINDLKISSYGDVSIKRNDEILSGDSTLRTGDILNVKFKNDNSSYTLSVLGDIDGSGTTDKNKIKIISKHIIDKKSLSDEYLYAADYNGDGKVKMNDVIKFIKALS